MNDIGDHQLALEALEKALGMAEAESHMRIFLDEGQDIADLLRRLKDRGVSRVGDNYIQKLLAAFNENSAPAPVDITFTELGESLSERELEVLRLLDTELSSAEIADHLFVSVHTVRSHIKSIYQKLEVHSRYQALVKAKQVGLI